MKETTEFSKGIQKVMCHLDQVEEKINMQLNSLILLVTIGIILLGIKIVVIF